MAVKIKASDIVRAYMDKELERSLRSMVAPALKGAVADKIKTAVVHRMFLSNVYAQLRAKGK